jgi:hypothetical protein
MLMDDCHLSKITKLKKKKSGVGGLFDVFNNLQTNE